MDCVLADNQEYCVSGCESGWTLYLDHSSSISPYASECISGHENRVFDGDRGRLMVEDEEDEEDMSMVSDASSGPPHLHGEDRCGGGPEEAGGGRGCFWNYPIVEDPLCERGRGKRRRNGQEQKSLLDDTASSPFFDVSDKKNTVMRSQHLEENVLEHSQGYSSTQYGMRPSYPEQYDFFHSAESANQLKQNQWIEGKSW